MNHAIRQRTAPPPAPPPPEHEPTSVSDIPLLHDSIKMILKYPEAWSNFRCTPGFLYAIENIAECWHKEIIDAVPPHDLIDQLFRGDIGNPHKMRLPNGGYISPTMLRYSYISRDFGRRFPMNNAHVLEIGGGWGGQCYVCNQHWPGLHWTLIDLPMMLEVARKYLEYFSVFCEFISCHVPKELIPTPLQLRSAGTILVSNYALTECTKAMQEFYLDNIIRHCPRGSIIANRVTASFDRLTIDQIVERIQNYRQCEVRTRGEHPKTGHDIVNVEWGFMA